MRRRSYRVTKVPAVADRLTDVVPGGGQKSGLGVCEKRSRWRVAQLRQGIKALDLAESAPKDPPKDDPLRGDEQICSATKSFQRTPDRADCPF
jgi:hypothetical protein